MRDIYMPESDPDYVGWFEPLVDEPENIQGWEDPEAIAWEAEDLSAEDRAELDQQAAGKALLEELGDMSSAERLAWRVESYFESGRRFRTQLKDSPIGWDDETTERLAKQSRAGDIQARNQLAEGQLRLLHGIAYKQYPLEHLNLEDQTQNGAIGLLGAMSRYEVERGTPLSSYVQPTVERIMQRGRHNQEREIRIPVSVHGLVGAVGIAVDQLAREVPQIEPSRGDIRERSHELGFTDEEVDTYLALPVADKGLDAAEHLVAPDELGVVENQVAANQILQDIIHNYRSKHSNKTPSRQASAEKKLQVMALRYGMYKGREFKLREIGKIFDFTHQAATYFHDTLFECLRSQPLIKELIEQTVIESDLEEGESGVSKRVY